MNHVSLAQQQSFNLVPPLPFVSLAQTSKLRRLSLSFRRRSRASALDVAASAEVSTATLPVPTASLASYERVELRQHRSTCMRPLVLLGPNKDIFSDQLLVEYPELFSACVPHTTRSPRAGEVNGKRSTFCKCSETIKKDPLIGVALFSFFHLLMVGVDYHFVSLEAMSHDIEAGKFLEVGQYKGHLYGTAFAAVRSVAERGVVCLVDASVDAIAHMHEADIQPMVIFLKPVSVQALIDQTPNMTPERATEAFAMAEKVGFLGGWSQRRETGAGKRCVHRPKDPLTPRFLLLDLIDLLDGTHLCSPVYAGDQQQHQRTHLPAAAGNHPPRVATALLGQTYRSLAIDGR